MASYKQRTLDFFEKEWGTYIARYNRWSKEEREKRVKEQGYQQLRDMLAHILAWWEEAMPILIAISENREYPRKKYDFDAFNAEAVAKYKSWDEAKFLAHFEETRQKAVADLKSVNEAIFEDRRAQRWIHGVVIEHAREHLVSLSRFLTLDILENEWAVYVERFNQIDDKETFLKNQGVESFRDMLAHVIGWWDVGLYIINGIINDPGFTWTEPNTDSYNMELIAKYKDRSLDDVLKQFETTRLAMIDLVSKLPEDAFFHKDIEGWLAADVVEHYEEHAV